MEKNRKLVRTLDCKIAGVCGGLAQYFDLDPTLVRVAYLLLTVFTAFSGVIAYIIMWVVIPEEQYGG